MCPRVGPYPIVADPDFRRPLEEGRYDDARKYVSTLKVESSRDRLVLLVHYETELALRLGENERLEEILFGSVLPVLPSDDDLHPRVMRMLAYNAIRFGRPGDLRAADRWAREGLSKLALLPARIRERLRTEHIALLAMQGLIFRRIGMLGAGERVYEQAITLAREIADENWIAFLCNALALTLIQHARFEEAQRQLDIADAHAKRPIYRVSGALTRVRLAIEWERFTCGQEAIDRIRENTEDLQVLARDWRSLAIHRELSAAVMLNDPSRVGDARDELEKLLGEVHKKTQVGDIVAEVERWLATALLKSGEPERALDHVRAAIAAAVNSDLIEAAAGYRIAGLCHVALNQLGDAQREFNEAASLLYATEFVVERERLYRAIDGAGLERPTAPSLIPKLERVESAAEFAQGVQRDLLGAYAKLKEEQPTSAD